MPCSITAGQDRHDLRNGFRTRIRRSYAAAEPRSWSDHATCPQLLPLLFAQAQQIAIDDIVVLAQTGTDAMTAGRRPAELRSRPGILTSKPSGKRIGCNMPRAW